jgi:hypothetical protein
MVLFLLFISTLSVTKLRIPTLRAIRCPVVISPAYPAGPAPLLLGGGLLIIWVQWKRLGQTGLHGRSLAFMLKNAGIRVWTLIVQRATHPFPVVSVSVKEAAVALASRPAARQNSTIIREIPFQSAIQRLHAPIRLHIPVPIASQFIPIFTRSRGCLVEAAPVAGS